MKAEKPQKTGHLPASAFISFLERRAFQLPRLLADESELCVKIVKASSRSKTVQVGVLGPIYYIPSLVDSDVAHPLLRKIFNDLKWQIEDAVRDALSKHSSSCVVSAKGIEALYGSVRFLKIGLLGQAFRFQVDISLRVVKRSTKS